MASKESESPVSTTAVVTKTLEDVIADALGLAKSTVVFEVSDKEYGNGQALSATRQFWYDPNCSSEEWQRLAELAADDVKILVYNQMNAEVRRNDNGVLERVFTADVMKAMPGSVVVTATAPHGPDMGGTTAGVGPNPPYFDSKFKGLSKEDAKPMYKANSDWAMARYEEYPQEFEDQRPGKASGEINQYAPDFKHKKHWRSGFYMSK